MPGPAFAHARNSHHALEQSMGEGTPMRDAPRRGSRGSHLLGLALAGITAGVGAADMPAHDAARLAADAGAAPLHLAQASGASSGQTLQFGAPAEAGTGSPAAGQTLQTGSPPAGEAGPVLQLGTPPPAGESLQIGTPPPPSEGLQIGAPPPPSEGLQIGAPPAPPGGGLQIGAPAPGLPAAPTMAPPEPERAVEFSAPWLRAEGGWLPDGRARASVSGYLSGALRADIRPEGFPAWSIRATVRGDAYPQSGHFDDSTTRLDYGESFVRYDAARTRITLGAQTVLWGRVDEIPPTDRMSVQDLTRYVLDELPDRRRAVPALRIEHALDAYKLDAVLMPWFRPAELPDQDSIWFPVRQEDGRMLGIRNPFPLYGEIIRNGTIGEADDLDGFGGAGVRVSRSGAGIDGAITVQRTRHSLPYYQLDPLVRQAVLQGQPLGAALASGVGPTFREVHPLTWLVGGDLAMEALGGTVRLEAAWLSDVPVTTLDARLETHDAFEWVGGYEFFPGDGNTRVTLQLAGRHVLDTPPTLDRTRVFNFSGEVEVPFAQELWRFNTRVSVGLNDRDIYVNPKLSYVGWEPHELYVAAHLFSGSHRSVNGFYASNDMIVLGWRARF
jgi:hypothetical protein